MEIIHVYNKYKSCIALASGLFKRYEKYHGCFSLSKVDNQMNTTFYRIAVLHSKMARFIINVTAPVKEQDMMPIISDEQDEVIQYKTIFLEHTLQFIEQYEHCTLNCLEDENKAEVKAHLHDLEYNVNSAEVLVNSMEGILKSSQYIYPNRLGVPA